MSVYNFAKFTGWGKPSKFSNGVVALGAAVAVALASGAASARTIGVTENRDANGVLTSVDLTFSEESADTANKLYVAYGTSDGGNDISAWDSIQYVGDVPGNVTSVPNVSLPTGWGETITHVRCFFLSSIDGIPGAMKLEYIASSGNSASTGQHVLTSFIPNGNSAVEVTLAFNGADSSGKPSGGNHGIFCARGESTWQNTFTLFWLKTNWRWDYNAQALPSSSCNSPGTAVHTIRADKDGLFVDGTFATGTNPGDSTFTAAGRMSIFATHTNEGNWGNSGSWKLYSFKAWSDGADPSTLALDLVPCKKNDGTVCLYDKKNGEFLLNTGSGSFTAGPVDASDVVVEASSDLVSVPRQGWMTTNGTFYPYIEGSPVYLVEVAPDDTKSISEVTFKEMAADGAALTNDVSFAAFTSGGPGSRTGTIIKRGEGTLTFNEDISAFKGPVHIEEGVAIGVCSNCFGLTEKAGGGVNQRTYVHSGATLVMDAVGNLPKPAESNATYYEGEGYPGMEGAFVARNGDTASGQSRWQMGCSSRAVGPASIYLDVPSGASVGITYNSSTGQAASDFRLNGQDVLMYGRTAGSELSLEAAQLNGIGNLVVSNMTLRISGNSGALYASNGNKSTIRVRGGARWVWDTYTNFNRFQEQQYSTVYVDDLEYIQFKNGTLDNNNYGVNPWGVSTGTTNNWYSGPVVLNNHIRLYNLHSPRHSSDAKRNYGCNFTAKISGPMGFRPYEKSDGTFWSDGVRLNLLYPTNTFEGGIVMDGGSLGVWAERAVPSQEGAGLVSITNGYVYFGKKGDERMPPTQKWVDFTMPVTEFVGECAVTNGTGFWQGLVKKGEGTLDYNSQLDGAYLDLQEGTVKFNTQYREKYSGDYAQYAPTGYEAALPAFTTLKGTAGTLDLEDVGGAYTVANVDGSPSVANGSLTVTNAWTLAASALGENSSNISGTLTFGEDAMVTVTGDIDSLQRPSGGFLIAKAASISGMPSFHLAGGSLQKCGGELR
ncbi:MAG: hypothetical protein IJI73_10265, partial [Kiritimatiellae bacterium]|nr:hypothetical protein [Kiritimatiellia bacterium]